MIIERLIDKPASESVHDDGSRKRRYHIAHPTEGTPVLHGTVRGEDRNSQISVVSVIAAPTPSPSFKPSPVLDCAEMG